MPKDKEIIELPEVETDSMIVHEKEEFEFTKFPENQAELDKALTKVDMRLKYVDAISAFLLKRTKPNDWLDQNGNPYFCEAGCNRMMAPFGIYEKDLTVFSIDSEGNKREISDKNMFAGDIRFFLFRGIIGSKLLGIESTFEGGAKLDDGFKGKEDSLFYLLKGKANWRGRGVRKLLGMENRTWDELEANGIKRDGIKAVTRTTTEKASSEDADKLWEKLLEMAGGDPIKAEDILEKTTKSDDGKYKGKRRPSQLSAASMKFVMSKLGISPKPTNGNGNGSEKHDPGYDSYVASVTDILNKNKGVINLESFLKEQGVRDWMNIEPNLRIDFFNKLQRHIEKVKTQKPDFK